MVLRAFLSRISNGRHLFKAGRNLGGLEVQGTLGVSGVCRRVLAHCASGGHCCPLLAAAVRTRRPQRPQRATPSIKKQYRCIAVPAMSALPFDKGETEGGTRPTRLYGNKTVIAKLYAKLYASWRGHRKAAQTKGVMPVMRREGEGARRNPVKRRCEGSDPREPQTAVLANWRFP